MISSSQRSAFLIIATAGVALSAASYFNWCVFEGCQALHGTEIFGAPVSIWGVAYFSVVAFLALFSGLRGAGFVRAFLLSAALGGEIVLVRIQWVLSEYCVVCLAVTAVVVALCLLEFMGFMQRRSRGEMSRLGLALGLVLASVGVVAGLYAARPVWDSVMPPGDYDRDQVRAELANIPYIGQTGQWPVVRFYSDFFCPFCRKQEPLAKEMVETFKDDARFYFLDLPIHGSASELYITMFLASFLAGNDDAKILAVRDELFHHSENKVLEPAALVTALRNMGVEMITEAEPLENAYASAIVLSRLDGIVSTPTVVVEDRLGRRKVFRGGFGKQELVDAIISMD